MPALIFINLVISTIISQEIFLSFFPSSDQTQQRRDVPDVKSLHDFAVCWETRENGHPPAQSGYNKEMKTRTISGDYWKMFHLRSA